MSQWFVPGRIEVFGKHTDYAGGTSLLAAVDRGVTATTSPADRLTITSDAFPHDEVVLTPGERLDAPAGHWGHYMAVVVDRLTKNFGAPAPTHLHLTSTLPPASGMSSSAALVCATVLALADDNGYTETEQWRDHIRDELELAHYCSCVENGYPYPGLPGEVGVGTLAGSEDHTAMLACREGEITEFSFLPSVRGESQPLPEGWTFVIAVSGVLAEKSGAVKERYNHLSTSARAIVERWNAVTGRDDKVLADALAVEDGLEGLRAAVAGDEALTTRLEAFVDEVRVHIPRALSALREGDARAFGQAAVDSHRNADRRLCNQIPETSHLVEMAVTLGAAGASAFGAGFGGSVWALVRSQDADQFAADWAARQRENFPATTPECFVTRPSAPGRRLA